MQNISEWISYLFTEFVYKGEYIIDKDMTNISRCSGFLEFYLGDIISIIFHILIALSALYLIFNMFRKEKRVSQ